MSCTKPSALKHSKSFSISQSVSFVQNKRVCLAPSWSRRNSASVAALFSSSSEDDDDSENDSCYLNNQRRARKRAFSLRKQSLSLADDKLNVAISQYSDIDDDDEKEKRAEKELDNGPLPSSTAASPGQKWSVEMPFEAAPRRDSQVSSFASDSKSCTKRTPAECDRIARNRCFEYLVSAIDEAWARYCDATSYAEDEVYNTVDYIPNTPASLGLSENEDDEEEDDEDVEEGYKSAGTNLTEYESEVESKKVSGQPSSVKLQQLKDRLLKAKYYLQDYLEGDQAEEAMDFWKRWDLIKYATIELVEDDDDDEVIESTIEELEKGRLYGCY